MALYATHITSGTTSLYGWLTRQYSLKMGMLIEHGFLGLQLD